MLWKTYNARIATGGAYSRRWSLDLLLCPSCGWWHLSRRDKITNPETGIRRALLFYLLDEMRLLTAVMRSDPELAKGTTLWIRNTEAVARELAGAKMKQAWPKT
jgi:hypothetical protein